MNTVPLEGVLVLLLVLPQAAQADQSPKQVQIETRFAEVSRDNERELGVDFDVSPGEQRNLDPKTAPPQTGTVSATFGDFTGVHPFPAGGLSVEPPATAPLALQTTPAVKTDGTIGLKVTPAVQTVTPPSALPTEVTVPVEGTLVVGGLATRPLKTSTEKTPAVRKIPLLGRLFSRHDEAQKKKELVVFMTPEVVKPADQD